MVESRNDNSEVPTISAGDKFSSERMLEDIQKYTSSIKGYQIVEELPRGGQGIVFKAIHTATNTEVALKLLLPGLLGSRKARHRFEQEIDLISGLRHPYIVRLRDSGVTCGQYFFAMEYIPGESLATYIKSKPQLSIVEKVKLFAKVCDALAYAHQRGVIHRDLKPGNILIDDRDDPHVLDFGLAKALTLSDSESSPESLQSISGEIKGTLPYMSPEQATGRTDAMDTRTDVYSLGIILYQLLTEEFPYDVYGTRAQTLSHIESAEPIRPRRMNKKIDADMEAIVLKCLEKETSHRYHSAADLQDDLQHWLHGDPVLAKSHSTLYLLKKLIIRYKVASSVLGLILVILVSNTIVSLFYYQRSQHSFATLTQNQQQSEQLASQRLALVNQVMFTMFLELWQDDKTDRASFTKHSFVENSKESMAAAFLLDPKPLLDKREKYQTSISAQSKGFWAFVLAEYYYKHNNTSMAIEAYRQCIEVSHDTAESNAWFVHQAEEKRKQLQK